MPPQYVPVHVKTHYKNIVHGTTLKYYGIYNKKYPYPSEHSKMLYLHNDDHNKIDIIDYYRPNEHVGEGGSMDTIWLVKFMEAGEYDIKLVTDNPEKDEITDEDITTINFNIRPGYM